jgi:hypothetical protein
VGGDIGACCRRASNTGDSSLSDAEETELVVSRLPGTDGAYNVCIFVVEISLTGPDIMGRSIVFAADDVWRVRGFLKSDAIMTAFLASWCRTQYAEHC